MKNRNRCCFYGLHNPFDMLCRKHCGCYAKLRAQEQENKDTTKAGWIT